MNILYATDGSDCAATAGRLLGALPLPDGARVTILSVIPDSSWIDYPALPEVALAMAAAEHEAALRVAEEAAVPFRDRGVHVDVRLRRGSPAEAILDQSEADCTDLIVVGSHGRRAAARFLVGSVSERVARSAHCSVLVGRGDHLKRVMVAVDRSEASDQALNAILRLPLPADLDLMCVHVHPPDALPSMLQPGGSLSEGALFDDYAEQYHAREGHVLADAKERLRAAGRTSSTQAYYGAPAEALIAATRRADADLIVVGAANKSALGRLFLGTVSGRVLTHAHCSVLIARTCK
jgi:nucleotide-binding universal stress UspA family protein